MKAPQNPLQAFVVDGDLFVCDADGGSDIWIAAEAVLDSLDHLRSTAEAAIRARVPDPAES